MIYECRTCGFLWARQETRDRCCVEPLDRDALARMFPDWESLPETVVLDGTVLRGELRPCSGRVLVNECYGEIS